VINQLRNKFILGLGIVSLSIPFGVSGALAAWTFTVTNSTTGAITSIEVREKGTQEWGSFNGGLAVGESATFEWGADSNNTSCNWEIRANYADGTTGDAATFNFCEKTDLTFDD